MAAVSAPGREKTYLNASITSAENAFLFFAPWEYKIAMSRYVEHIVLTSVPLLRM